jgi:hypothetical protein
MKKLLPIILLAGSVFFLLAGCDAMLESIYPEETGHGGGTNSITLVTEIDPDTYIDYYLHEIYFELQDSNGVVLQTYSNTPSYNFDTEYAEASVTFAYLADGNYSVFAWYDSTYNAKYDNSEAWNQTSLISLNGGIDPTETLLLY